MATVLLTIIFAWFGLGIFELISETSFFVGALSFVVGLKLGLDREMEEKQ